MKEVYKYFPKHQVLCLKQEDLQNDPVEALKKLVNHIGIRELADIENEEVHRRTYDAPIDPQDARYLQNVYSEDLRRFGEITNLDVSDWLPSDRSENLDSRKYS